MLSWTLPVVGLHFCSLTTLCRSHEYLKMHRKKKKEQKQKMKPKFKNPPKTPKQNTELISFQLKFTMFLMSFKILSKDRKLFVENSLKT